MFTLLDDGYVRVTGRQGVYKMPDMKMRAEKRAMRAPEVHPFAGIGADIGCPVMSLRLAETLARQSIYGQERLSDTYKVMLRDFSSNRLDAVSGIVHNIARQFKAGPARKTLGEKLPSLFGAMHQPIRDAVDLHIGKLSSARAHLADALAPDLPADPAAALAQSIRAMETRARAAQMAETDRIVLIHQLGEGGNFEALVMLRDDPLGIPAAPARVLNDALRAAVTMRGGECFYAAVEDAVEDLETVAVIGELMHSGMIASLQEAGVPQDMLYLQCDYQQRAGAAINQ